jgi:hypothetical protein
VQLVDDLVDAARVAALECVAQHGARRGGALLQQPCHAHVVAGTTGHCQEVLPTGAGVGVDAVVEQLLHPVVVWAGEHLGQLVVGGCVEHPALSFAHASPLTLLRASMVE